MPQFNDLDLKDWRESEIWTDSLWLINERDKTGKHSNFYHGNFVPQIPHQFILRYTKKGDVVFDPFVGSGTTAYEAEALDRSFIGVDIKKELLLEIGKNLDHKDKIFSELICGDSSKKKTIEAVQDVLKKHNKEKAQLAILHPPYFDIIKFSDKKSDLSNCSSVEAFSKQFGEVIENTLSILEKGRYLVIVIGDKYSQGRWIPLNFYCFNEAVKRGLILKAIIIKNMAGNRAKQNKEAIWRYRALASDYYIFKHEYILVFKY